MESIVATQGRTLDELAVSINRGHRDVLSALVNALQNAIRTGDDLLIAREQFSGRVGWHKWCEDNLEMSKTTTGKYMRLAYYKDHLPDDLLNAPYDHNRPGVNMALEYIRGLPALYGRGSQRRVDYSEARRLVSAGVPKKEAARILGTSPFSIRRAVMTTAERKQYDARVSRMKEARQKAYDQAQANKLARKKGGHLSEAYAQLRRSLDSAQRSYDQSNGNQRQAIAEAISAMHAAEDAFGKALRSRERTRHGLD